MILKNDMTNSGLLIKLDECVYPEGFLVARLHGKLGGLFHDWDLLIANDKPAELLQDTALYSYLSNYGADGVWQFLRLEHKWIYKRMNNRLRIIFEPYFIFQEISSLMRTIRHIQAKHDEKVIMRQLEDSLLGIAIQEILSSGQDFHKTLHALEAYFTSKTNRFCGLSGQYEKNGLRGLEMFLREKFVALIMHQCNSPLLKTFFSYMIAFYNCMELAKSQRWEVAEEHVYLDGGTIRPEKFRRAHFKKNPDVVLKIFPIPGAAEESTSVIQLEKTLLCLITRVLRRWASQRTTVGEILFYLWEQYRYARNISMVVCTLQLKDEMVREGIIA